MWWWWFISSANFGLKNDNVSQRQHSLRRSSHSHPQRNTDKKEHSVIVKHGIFCPAGKIVVHNSHIITYSFGKTTEQYRRGYMLQLYCYENQVLFCNEHRWKNFKALLGNNLFSQKLLNARGWSLVFVYMFIKTFSSLGNVLSLWTWYIWRQNATLRPLTISWGIFYNDQFLEGIFGHSLKTNYIFRKGSKNAINILAAKHS